MKISRREYNRIHQQLKRKRTKPSACEHCGTTENVQWANISGEYKNLEDFFGLCPPCHHKYDTEKHGKKNGGWRVIPEPICEDCGNKIILSPDERRIFRKLSV